MYEILKAKYLNDHEQEMLLSKLETKGFHFRGFKCWETNVIPLFNCSVCKRQMECIPTVNSEPSIVYAVNLVVLRTEVTWCNLYSNGLAVCNIVFATLNK